MKKTTKPSQAAGQGGSIIRQEEIRARLIAVLVTMPDEAFGWFVAWAMTSESISHFKYPDGLGGFQQASRDAIEQLRAAAKAYMEALEAR